MILAFFGCCFFFYISSISSQFGYFYNHIYCFLHTFYWYIFIFSMKIMSARKDIWARQTFVGQLASVCTASNWFYNWFDADFSHCFFGNKDNMFYWKHFFFHIVILIFDLRFDNVFTKLLRKSLVEFF